MGIAEFEKICSVLSSKGIGYEHIIHEHVHRSEEAAKIRGNRIEQAAKAIVLKVRSNASLTKEYEFIQCVIAGHKKIDMKKLKNILSLDKASLASPEEVLSITNCSIGSVPPFGVLLGIRTFADKSVFDEEYIFFSAGTHNDSIKMKSSDYKSAIQLEIIEVSLD